jgi:MinD-like ATPase involved in chromosome partitioning or flagellar assembly
VGVVDTDIQSPGIHVLFGLKDEKPPRALNDYLWGKCKIEQTAQDVTARLGAPLPGKVYLIPSSVEPGEIARILREGYDVGLLNDGFVELGNRLKLDVLVIDTHPGINEETLLSITISDVLVVIMRPDQQDYQGTGVTVSVARKLEVPRMLIVVNKLPPGFDAAEVRAQVERIYDCEVAAILPHSDDVMSLASAGIFSLRYPDHLVTQLLKDLAARVMA